MKIAYIILAHKNPPQMARMLQALSHDGASFFVHIDRKVTIDPFVAAVSDRGLSAYFVPDRQDVLWGGYSMVQATVDTLAAALSAGPHDYYILLSGSDYPIRSTGDLLAELGEARHEYINRHRMPADHVGKPISRLQHPYRATRDPRKPQARIINGFLRLLPKQDYKKVLGELEPHGGSQWWCLSEPCIRYILQFIDSRPEFVSFFRTVKIPDEIMFHTILSRSPFEDRVKPALMFTTWEQKGMSPRTLTAAQIPQLRESGKFFARKFDLDADPGIFDLIDSQLRR
ncbi:beta-1,6-N-acetylglucosaminyltransferase [Skermanella mucosa]|nr:beta-1,6-N-acetylglucosaminyltransferase [Skermanella mucosa]UEM22437.1 beta-1,6-N-acetylglucosaminyltransferase [Skermanella mucosa]